LIEEDIELREAGLMLPILVMGGHYGQAFGELIRHRLTPVISRRDQLEGLAEEIRFSGSAPLPVHIKIDTGMARLGVPLGELDAFATTLAGSPEIALDGVMTHFACAESDPASVAEQIERFERGCAVLRAHGLSWPRRHAANTAATIAHPSARFDLVRPGIGLFGLA